MSISSVGDCVFLVGISRVLIPPGVGAGIDIFKDWGIVVIGRFAHWYGSISKMNVVFSSNMETEFFTLGNFCEFSPPDWLLVWGYVKDFNSWVEGEGVNTGCFNWVNISITTEPEGNSRTSTKNGCEAISFVMIKFSDGDFNWGFYNGSRSSFVGGVVVKVNIVSNLNGSPIFNESVYVFISVPWLGLDWKS